MAERACFYNGPFVTATRSLDNFSEALQSDGDLQKIKEPPPFLFQVGAF